jgi:hypothetical protein
MRKTLLAITVLMLPAFGALAEQPGLQKTDRSAASGKALPLKRASSGNACAAYGPGFVKLEGSDTCVKTGGAASVDVGTSRGNR